MRPAFIDGQHGDLFTLYFPAADNTAPRGDLIAIPGFAEEMNRSRTIIAAQARVLQNRGFGVLLLDPYGTGDSEGDFADARWEFWRDDVIAATDWIESQGNKVLGLWGIRLGGLLAADLVSWKPGRFNRLLLWDPVTSGKSYLDRFLRIAATSPQHDAKGIALTGDRIRLDHSDPLEVAGYPISRSLMHGISRTDMAGALQGQSPRIDWLDLRLRDQARQVDVEAVRTAMTEPAVLKYRQIDAQPFWSVQDVRPDPEIFAATLELLDAEP